MRLAAALLALSACTTVRTWEFADPERVSLAVRSSDTPDASRRVVLGLNQETGSFSVTSGQKPVRYEALRTVQSMAVSAELGELPVGYSGRTPIFDGGVFVQLDPTQTPALPPTTDPTARVEIPFHQPLGPSPTGGSIESPMDLGTSWGNVTLWKDELRAPLEWVGFVLGVGGFLGWATDVGDRPTAAALGLGGTTLALAGLAFPIWSEARWTRPGDVALVPQLRERLTSAPAFLGVSGGFGYDAGLRLRRAWLMGREVSPGLHLLVGMSVDELSVESGGFATAGRSSFELATAMPGGFSWVKLLLGAGLGAGLDQEAAVATQQLNASVSIGIGAMGAVGPFELGLLVRERWEAGPRQGAPEATAFAAWRLGNP